MSQTAAHLVDRVIPHVPVRPGAYCMTTALVFDVVIAAGQS
jgi:hypothetical protein